MIYRADRADGKGKVEGYYVVTKLKVEGYLVTTKLVDEIIHWITDGIYPYSGLVPKFTEIKPETLEVFFFGEWRLVSELEKPCEWELDKDDTEGDSWYTSCGQRDISFCTGSAKENKYKFCPYCGRPIKEI